MFPIFVFQENIFAVGGDDRLVLIVDVLTGTHLFNVDAAKSTEDNFSRYLQEKFCTVRSFQILIKELNGDECSYFDVFTFGSSKVAGIETEIP